MTACEALREEANLAYTQLSGVLEPISEPLAWAQINLAPGEYLHTNGAIIGVVQHIAVCKFMYASHAFRGTETRWRHCMDRLDKINTNWAETRAYLAEAHRYWMSAWESLTDADPDKPHQHFRGREWPGWKVIATVTQHDAYHAGQIAVFAAALVPTDAPPDLRLAEERKHLLDLPGW